MKVVYKYGTGHEIPSNAKYLCTQVETISDTMTFVPELGLAAGAVSQSANSRTVKNNNLVWHYYEIELDGESKK